MGKVITRQITYILLCMVFALFVVPQLGAQEAPPEVIQAAEEGLPSFLLHITPATMEGYGFSEDDNLDEAFLGRPFLQYFLYTRQILNYEERDTIYDVLTGSSEWYFPIMIGDEARCLLLVAKIDNEWDMAAAGYAGTAK